MERDDVLNTRIPAVLKDALRRAAADDQRTMSALLAIVLGEWLAARGYLKPANPPARSASTTKKRKGG